MFKAKKGLNKEVVNQISDIKNEPDWMREFRLKSLEMFEQRPMPKWGGAIDIDFQDIFYYLKPTDHQGKTWDDVPQEIKDTFDKLGNPGSGEEVSGRREGSIRKRSRLRIARRRPGQAGRDLHRHRHGGP